MLKPLEPSENPSNFFLVSDIECYAKPHPKEGELLAIDTCWRTDEGKIEHIKHFNWDMWWDWVISTSKDDERFRTIYAHNGGGYDWISFVQFALHEGKNKRQALSAACSGSRMVTLNITIEKSHSVHLCDSLQLLRSKLDDLAKVFVGKRKIDTGDRLPHELWEQDRQLFDRYHSNDTEVLLEIMEKALFLMRDKVAKIESFGYTIGSTAMKVFRTIGMEREISVPSDKYLKDFLRVGYRGGRVECFKPGYYDKVTVYDINSLYPFAMKSTPVPVSDRGFWTTKYTENSISCFEIEWNQKRRDVFPVLMLKGNGVYNGKGIFFSPEIDLLRSIDPDCSIHFSRGYEFIETDYIFRSFVDRLYQLRLDYPDTKENKSPIALLAKFLLNSLYGKFGQHAERESIISDSEINLDNLPDNGESDIRVINPRLGVCGLMKQSRCEFEHVGIAGMITSVARVQLYKGLLSAGFSNVVYCDTDSVHTTGMLADSIVGRELGMFKNEGSGSGVYAGKKLYGLRSPDGKEKIRVKGVSCGGKFGAKITFADLEKVVQGDSMVCNFQQFATPLEIFTEKSRAGVLRKRKRTIRRLK